MHIVICGDDKYRPFFKPVTDTGKISWVADCKAFATIAADAYIDLDFENDKERVLLLSKLNRPVAINSVAHTLSEVHQSFIRFNGWMTFISGLAIEATASEDLHAKADSIFAVTGKKINWVPDSPGFIAPRVVAMIINEAYHALGDSVSSKKDIDTAMKLGTGYPYGPFEWASLIGLPQIHKLLQRLQQENEKYSPASLLKKEVANGIDPAY